MSRDSMKNKIIEYLLDNADPSIDFRLFQWYDERKEYGHRRTVHRSVGDRKQGLQAACQIRCRVSSVITEM